MKGNRYRARTPRGGGSTAGAGIVGLVGRDLTAPLFVELAEGLQHSIREANRILLLASSHDDAGRLGEVLESFWSLMAEGVIVFGDVGRREQVSRFARRGLPVVVVGDCVETSNVACVGFDVEMAARLAVEHMAGAGRRRIAMMGLRTGSPGRSPAERGFLAAVAAVGVRGAIVRAEATVEGGRAALGDLLARFRDVDGLLAHDDLMAMGAIRAATALGIRIPADIAVVSANDMGLSSLAIPSLTTVSVDRNRLIEAVTGALGQLIDTPGRRPESVVVPLKLVVRESA